MLSRIINVCGSIYTYCKNLVVKLDDSGGPLVTYCIIGICSFIFLYGPGWAFSISNLLSQPFAIIGYQFTHPTFSHLFGNMLFLMLFGPACEKYLGHTKYAFLFLMSGIISAIGFTLIWTGARVVGASGAISGLLAIFPFVQKRCYERVVSAVICILYFWMQIVSSIQDIQLPILATVAHLAHIFGGVAGISLFAYYFRKE
jgi:membrane associated rhomboid family serine protease